MTPAALRALLAKAVAWRDLEESADRAVCVKCNCVTMTESDDEQTPFCYSCAQEMIDELPALLDVVEAAELLRNRMCEAERLDTSFDVSAALVRVSAMLDKLALTITAAADVT